MSEPDPSYQQIRYNEYSKQRSELTKTNVDLAGRYDQWILTLSAGAVGVSIAFLEKIAPHPEPNTLYLLGLAWALLCVALLAGFMSLLTAQYSAARQVEILDDEYLEFRESVQKPIAEGVVNQSRLRRNKFSEWTHFLNCISAPAFVLGVIFLCAFAYGNIPAANTNSPLPPKVDVNVRIQNTSTNKP